MDGTGAMFSFLRSKRSTCFILLVAAMIPVVGSCSMYQPQESQTVNTESTLAQAGFKKVPVDTAADRRAVRRLELCKLNRYQSASGSIFWYADPDHQCLYEGDQQAYESYGMLLKQQDDTAAYVLEWVPESGKADPNRRGYCYQDIPIACDAIKSY